MRFGQIVTRANLHRRQLGVETLRNLGLERLRVLGEGVLRDEQILLSCGHFLLGAQHVEIGYHPELGFGLIGVPVRVGDPFNRVAIPKKFREPDGVLGSLTVAIGLGLED